MKRNVFARCIAPGFGQTETVTDHIDMLLDFAQFYEHPDFNLLAQSCSAIEKKFGDVLCKDIPEEQREFFLEIQGDIILHASNRIHSEERFSKRNAQAIEKRIHEHPGDAVTFDCALALDLVRDTFENLFSEEVDDLSWHERLIAKMIWHFDNWFGNNIAAIYSLFTTDMVEEVQYWKLAREVSVARAFGGHPATHKKAVSLEAAFCK